MAPDARDLQDRVPARGEALYPTGPAAGAVGRKLRHARKWRRKDMKKHWFRDRKWYGPSLLEPTRSGILARRSVSSERALARPSKSCRFWRLTH
jgi:hypothetical protein